MKEGFVFSIAFSFVLIKMDRQTALHCLTEGYSVRQYFILVNLLLVTLFP